MLERAVDMIMIGLQKTAKFHVLDIIPSSTQKITHAALPSLPEYTNKALKVYRQYVEDDMDWDIYEACAISTKEQRQLTDAGNDLIPALTYGEIDFECLTKLFYRLKVDHCIEGDIPHYFSCCD